MDKPRLQVTYCMSPPMRPVKIPFTSTLFTQQGAEQQISSLLYDLQNINHTLYLLT
jgi:hypothetical protein